MGKLSNLAADVKRKLTTGGIELVLGIGILIYSAVTKSSLYTYAGALFAGSGAVTIILCLLRIFVDKKAADKKAAKQETQQEQVNQTSENVVEVEEVKNEEQVVSQQTSQDTTSATDTEETADTTSDTSDSTDTEK